MDSIWMKNEKNDKFKTLSKDIKTDTLIIGGGMFGITCRIFTLKRGWKCDDN